MLWWKYYSGWILFKSKATIFFIPVSFYKVKLRFDLPKDRISSLYILIYFSFFEIDSTFPKEAPTWPRTALLFQKKLWPDPGQHSFSKRSPDLTPDNTTFQKEALTWPRTTLLSEKKYKIYHWQDCLFNIFSTFVKVQSSIFYRSK